jgi:hypothetical protein
VWANQRLKVTFAPAVFGPGSERPNPAAHRYLDQLRACRPALDPDPASAPRVENRF